MRRTTATITTTIDSGNGDGDTDDDEPEKMIKKRPILLKFLLLGVASATQ